MKSHLCANLYFFTSKLEDRIPKPQDRPPTPSASELPPTTPQMNNSTFGEDFDETPVQGRRADHGLVALNPPPKVRVNDSEEEEEDEEEEVIRSGVTVSVREEEEE